MKLVEKVKILYKTYVVKQIDNLHDGGGDLYGQVDYIEQIIRLNPRAQLDQAKSTLLHEIIHALSEVYCIDLKEEQVEKLGTALYQLTLDNPELFEKEDLLDDTNKC